MQNDKNMHVTALIWQGCQPPTSSNMENWTSLPATTKRLTGALHQGLINGFSGGRWGGGGGLHDSSQSMKQWLKQRSTFEILLLENQVEDK